MCVCGGGDEIDSREECIAAALDGCGGGSHTLRMLLFRESGLLLRCDDHGVIAFVNEPSHCNVLSIDHSFLSLCVYIYVLRMHYVHIVFRLFDSVTCILRFVQIITAILLACSVNVLLSCNLLSG